MATFPKRQILLTAEELGLQIIALAKEIAAKIKLKSDEILLLVCVLESAHVFANKLREELSKIGVKTDLEFITSKSYNGMESNGHPIITFSETLKDKLNQSLKNRQILIIEDMIDTGATLANLVSLILTFEPASVNVAVLLQKIRNACDIGLQPFVAFRIPNLWVDGFGIDTNQKNRELPDLWAVLLDDDNEALLQKFREMQEATVSDLKS